ncbi:hypothetical protein AB0B89_23530 [Sphaerisporangium sp. NPDC049002]|uniref:hypothetical protein n=1 Tax=unclassified Sphaerisporangium TaxID=2630420 RepID=UPI0033FC7841
MIHRSPRKTRPATALGGAVGPTACPEAFSAGADEELRAGITAKPVSETGAGGRG